MGGQYKRIYFTTAGVTSLAGLFAILTMIGIQFNDISGDFICSGTIEEPCVSYFDVINPTAKSVYIYNNENITLSFIPEIENYQLYIKYYNKWVPMNFTMETRLGNIPKDRKYVFVFPRYSKKQFKLVGYKHNPSDKVKWTFGIPEKELDPLWDGVIEENVTLLLDGWNESRKYEYGTYVNVTAIHSNCSTCEVCLGSDAIGYNESFICGEGVVNITYLVSDVREENFSTGVSENTTFVEISKSVVTNVSLVENTTVSKFRFNLTGWNTAGSYPENVICDIMNNSINDFVLPGTLVETSLHQDRFIDKTDDDTIIFKQSGNKVVYLNLSCLYNREEVIRENITLNITSEPLNSESLSFLYRFVDDSWIESHDGEGPFSTYEDFSEGLIEYKWYGFRIAVSETTPPYFKATSQISNEWCDNPRDGHAYFTSQYLDFGRFGSIKLRYFLEIGGCCATGCYCTNSPYCYGGGWARFQVFDKTTLTPTNIVTISGSAWCTPDTYGQVTSSSVTGYLWLVVNQTTKKIEFWRDSTLTDSNYQFIGSLSWDDTHQYEIQGYAETFAVGRSEGTACGGSPGAGVVTGSGEVRLYWVNVSGFTGVKTANFTWANGTLESKQIANFSENLSTGVLTAEFITEKETEPPRAIYYLSADNGTTWETVQSGIVHLFETSGKDLKFKVFVENLNQSDANYKAFFYHGLVSSIGVDVSQGAPSNVSIDIGNDGTIEWRMNNSLLWNESYIANWTGLETSSAFPLVCSETYGVPISFYSDSEGVLRIKQLDANTTFLNFNFDSLSSSLSSFTEKNSTEIPIACTSSNINSNIEFSGLDAQFIDEKNITFTAMYDGSNITYPASNQSLQVEIRYSPYIMSYPPYVSQWEIRPTKLIQYNITPVGQVYGYCNVSANTSICKEMSIPIFNFTSLAKNETFDIFVRFNETIEECVNITLSNTTSKNDGRIINATDQKLLESVPLYGSDGLFMTVDLNCNTTALRYFNPQFIFNPVCSTCVWQTDVEGV